MRPSPRVRDLLAFRRIAYHPGHPIARVDAAGRRLHLGNGADWLERWS